MKILYDQNLSLYTTFQIGGQAKKIYIPETTEELLELIQTTNIEYYIGGGSNLLINDSKSFPNVISLQRFDKNIVDLGNGRFKAGASIRLQELIIYVNEQGYGGFEYLYSVPGLLGGAIVMNAGRGRSYNKSISDYIISIDVYHDNKITTLNKEMCEFNYRDSIFRKNGSGSYIILSAELQLVSLDPKECEHLRKERIEFCKKNQDNTAPNIGTVFCNSDPTIMSFFKNTQFNKSGGICFSEKTLNWMLNYNKGNYKDVIRLIRRVEKMHETFGKKCEIEIIIWD